MARKSAGILLYKRSAGGILVLLVHPGGPFWSRRDAGAWSIPKGEFEDTEDPQDAARREFREEIGMDAAGTLLPLGSGRQRGGKTVFAFALEGDFDVTGLRSNLFDIEWPPRSGRMQSFPEVDRIEWFDLVAARQKILSGQLPFLDRLEVMCAA